MGRGPDSGGVVTDTMSVGGRAATAASSAFLSVLSSAAAGRDIMHATAIRTAALQTFMTTPRPESIARGGPTRGTFTGGPKMLPLLDLQLCREPKCRAGVPLAHGGTV